MGKHFEFHSSYYGFGIYSLFSMGLLIGYKANNILGETIKGSTLKEIKTKIKSIKK